MQSILPILAIAAGLAMPVLAGSPPFSDNFVYQGRLEQSGAPADGTYDFRFELYRGAGSTNSASGPAFVDAIEVTEGVFTAEVPLGFAIDGTGLWLEVAVKQPADPDYTVLTPRHRLQATPHAVYAAALDHPIVAGEVDDNAIQLRVGGSCPSDEAIRVIGADGTVTCQTAGGSKWNGVAGDAIHHAGKVGIGILPTADLHVAGSEVILPGLRLEKQSGSTDTVHVLGGSIHNSVVAELQGATIAGGGSFAQPNAVNTDFSTVGGGQGNTAGKEDTGSTPSTGIHNNTVSGGRNNTADGGNSTVGGGRENVASGIFSTVGGGRRNTASGGLSTVAGGVDNTVGTTGAAVGGGSGNSALGMYAVISGGKDNSTGSSSNLQPTVGGGLENTALGISSTVSGGWGNTAGGARATIGGGRDNLTGANEATVGGGHQNVADAENATVAGGEQNTASGTSAMIPGGHANTAAGAYSFAAGSNAKAIHDGAFIWADATSVDFTSAWANEYAARASGGVRFAVGNGGWQIQPSGATDEAPNVIAGHATNEVSIGTIGATISGGGRILGASVQSNSVTSNYSVVAGGVDNRAHGPFATTSGGRENYAADTYAVVGGGRSNTAVNIASTVGGGNGNTASGWRSTVAGGHNNSATATTATVSGGDSNNAEGTSATIPGGADNTAAGNFSFAAGRRAKANHDGTFVWADSTDADFASSGVNQFIARATGGVGFGEAPSDYFVINTPFGTQDTDYSFGTGALRVRINGATRFRVLGNGGVAIGNSYQVSGVPERGMRVSGLVELASLGTGGTEDLCRDNSSGAIATCSSSRRYKEEIVTLDSVLDLVEQLRPVSYRWIDTGMPDLGLVAEEVAAVEPRLVTFNGDGEIEGVKYRQLAAVLVGALQEQQSRLHQVDAELARLRQVDDELARLRRDLTRLRHAFEKSGR